MKNKVLKIGLALLVVAIMVTSNVFIATNPNLSAKFQKILTIGMSGVAYAETPDYVCDGAEDNIQVQEALDALPATGGKLVLFAGDYDFHATVLRAIDNVCIEGGGYATYVNAGATDVFDDGGQDNWVFKNFRTGAGGITRDVTNGSMILGCWIDTTYTDDTYLLESDLLIVEGAELAPAMTQALWTEGAGWTINDGLGTATRAASAVTTMEPTTPIVPSTSKEYKLTFTISAWTTGTITVTFGNVTSSDFSGNQSVSLYVSPFGTGNLIFTPTATFAGVITLVSVKEFTGGQITIEGDILYYDSRGHANRLSHVTRHFNEMSIDTLLDRSRSTLTCTGGVLTYTLYGYYGDMTLNFNGIIYVVPASVSISLIAGNATNPKTNWVYFALDGNTPTLYASITEPTGVTIMVAQFIVGAVSGSTYTIYGYNRYRMEVDSFAARVIHRFVSSGSLYTSGALPTVIQTTLSVASGGKWCQGIFDMTADNTVTATSFYYIKNGLYYTGTTLAELLFYSDGTALGGHPNHEYANIVWGIVPTTTTASGTLPTTVKLFAVLQTDPVVTYTTIAAARQDLYDAINYFPPDTQLKEIFVPIARTIVYQDAPTNFQTFDTGLYLKDIRGQIMSGGGAPTSTDITGLIAKTDTFAGDVTGNYTATVVGDDSHAHTGTTLTLGGNVTEYIVTDSGNVTPSGNIISILGTGGATTSGSGSTVTINTTAGGVTGIVGGTGISASANTGNVTVTNTGVTSLAANSPASVSGATGAVTVTIGNATTSVLGVASFTSTDFAVTAGAVTLSHQRNIVLMAGSGWSTTTAGCAYSTLVESTTNKENIWYADFDKDTDENIEWSIILPNDFATDATATMTAQFVWTAASGSGNVTWACKWISYGDNEVIDAAYGTAQSVTDTLQTANYKHVSSATAAITGAGTPAAGEFAQIRVYRDVSEDGLTTDARLMSVILTYHGK